MPLSELTLRRRVTFHEVDSAGIVHFSIYFRYMETVRLEWLFRFGPMPDADGNGPVIVNAFCNFIKQLEFPGDVLAKHYVAKPGRSSFEAYVTLERTDDPGVVYASGGARTVWVNYARQKSVPLPESVRQLIA